MAFLRPCLTSQYLLPAPVKAVSGLCSLAQNMKAKAEIQGRLLIPWWQNTEIKPYKLLNEQPSVHWLSLLRSLQAVWQIILHGKVQCSDCCPSYSKMFVGLNSLNIW